MDCRHPLVPAVAGMLLVAGARVHAGEAGTPGPLQVTGGDFPALVMVVPGDQLRMEIKLLRFRMGMAKVAGRALVDGELACEAEMLFGGGGK